MDSFQGNHDGSSSRNRSDSSHDSPPEPPECFYSAHSFNDDVEEDEEGIPTTSEDLNSQGITSESSDFMRCDSTASSQLCHSISYYERDDGVRRMEWEEIPSRSFNDGDSLSHDPLNHLERSEQLVDDVEQELQELLECRRNVSMKWSVERMKQVVGINEIEYMVQSWLGQVDREILLVARTKQRNPLKLLPWRKNRQKAAAALAFRRLRELKMEGNELENILRERPRHLPIYGKTVRPPFKLVGHQDTLSEIQQLVKDETIGIAGIHGMGGIGKTRILQEFHCQLVSNNDVGFDVVMWIAIPKNPSVFQIRTAIADQLNLVSNHPEVIYYFLFKMQFLLILDGLEEVIDLKSAGIPRPDGRNKSIIIISSRSSEVCELMDAKAIGVRLLRQEESLQVLGHGLHPNEASMYWKIEMVKCCHGLPLALVRIREAMDGGNLTEYMNIIPVDIYMKYFDGVDVPSDWLIYAGGGRYYLKEEIRQR